MFEPEENSLRVLIDRCNANNTKGFVKITDEVEIEAPSIDVDNNLPILQLDFETYVVYSIIDESFTVTDDYEISDGNLFRMFSKSSYLDFIKTGTIAEDINPERLAGTEINPSFCPKAWFHLFQLNNSFFQHFKGKPSFLRGLFFIRFKSHL